MHKVVHGCASPPGVMIFVLRKVGLCTTKPVCGWLWVSESRSVVKIFLVICSTNTVFEVMQMKHIQWTIPYGEQCMHGCTDLKVLLTVPNIAVQSHCCITALVVMGY